MKRIVLLVVAVAGWLLAAAQQPVKVACVGNSITYGTGIADRENDSYPAQLQRMLGEGYVVGNFGRPGATLLNKGHRPYTQQEEYLEALKFAGDIVVIHLGVNDTDPRNWPNYRDEFIGDYRTLIDAFRHANPACRILIARLTPISHRHARFESGTRDWRDEIQVAIEQVARHADVQLIDFHEPLYPYPNLFPDGLHPDPAGAGKLARTVYEGITGDFGGLQMPLPYSDNMVLQHGRPLTLQGKANAGDKVTVTLGGQRREAVTDSRGRWSVTLEPLQAGGPYTLTIQSGARKLAYRNVLAGEVWLCSGQSNMEFMLSQCATAAEDIPAATNDQIRLFDMKARWRTNDEAWSTSALDSVNQLQYYKASTWSVCTPEQAARFSAIAYHFGRQLQARLKVPVGLICNAVGGSPTEAWVDRRSLEYHFPAILRQWDHNDFVQEWVRERAARNKEQSTHPLQRHPYETCYLYEAGILPLTTFPIRGVIWYQGESNAHNKDAHAKLFRLLVESWRTTWHDKTLPFYFVQLSSLDRPSWPWFRDSQRRLMNEIPGTGMAVCTDKGDSLDVHPLQKREVGERLAAWALHSTYGQEAVVPSGPLYKSVEFVGPVAYLRFDYGEGMTTEDGGPLRTFEIAGDDGLFHPARASVEQDRIKVWCEDVKQPCAVRYGWQPFTRANLVNGAGLPASTFTTE